MDISIKVRLLAERIHAFLKGRRVRRSTSSKLKGLQLHSIQIRSLVGRGRLFFSKKRAILAKRPSVKGVNC